MTSREGLGPQRKQRLRAEGMSWKMIAVIVAMLLVIIVPAAVMTLPLSKVVITLTNLDTMRSVDGHLSVFGVASYVQFSLEAGEEREWTYTLSAGSYSVNVNYLYPGVDSYYDYTWRSFTVSFMGTEEVNVYLQYSPW